MAAQMVRCECCGKSFDYSKGGSYDERRKRFVCPACGGGTGRAAARVKRPSVGGTIAKVAFGLLFLAVSFNDPETGDRLTYMMVAMVTAFALIAWGILPWLRVWKEDKRRAEEQSQLREEKIRLRVEKETVAKTCPSCGATGTGKTCEYCGSPLL